MALSFFVAPSASLKRAPTRSSGCPFCGGTPEVDASSLQADDFAFDADGSIFAATQSGNIIRLHPNGTRTTMPTGTLGGAAVALGRRRSIFGISTSLTTVGLPRLSERATRHQHRSAYHEYDGSRGGMVSVRNGSAMV